MCHVRLPSDLLFLDIHTEHTCYFWAHINLGVLPFIVVTCGGVTRADISLSILSPVT